MKVLIVSDARSIHTRRWTTSLRKAGVDVILYSINPVQDDFFQKEAVPVRYFDLFSYKRRRSVPVIGALVRHWQAVRDLRQVLKEEQPDILHAHYATSYGLIAALAGWHPFILSVWGSDVYEFPRLSRVNRKSVEWMLSKADRVLSTSEVMAEETRKYFHGDIGITPFGVDTAEFTRNRDLEEKGTVVFGTAKTLSPKYGVDVLLRAFARLQTVLERRCAPSDVPRTRLVIAGKGPDRQKLERLAETLGIRDKVEFLGYVEHDSLPDVYSRMDVAVFLSREESFGVSAVEAMSCSCPVVTSDADGFREVVGEGGIIVPKDDFIAAAQAMADLALDSGRRKSLGQAGRERVIRLYEWDDNVASVVREYERISVRP